jgi:hypothetical protein
MVLRKMVSPPKSLEKKTLSGQTTLGHFDSCLELQGVKKRQDIPENEGEGVHSPLGGKTQKHNGQSGKPSKWNELPSVDRGMCDNRTKKEDRSHGIKTFTSQSNAGRVKEVQNINEGKRRTDKKGEKTTAYTQGEGYKWEKASGAPPSPWKPQTQWWAEWETNKRECASISG